MVARVPGPGAEVTTLRPTFRVVFSEQIQKTTWSPVGFVLQDPSGAAVRGSYSYDDGTFTGTFVPSVGLVPGSAYLASLSGITDLAGNPLASPGTWVVTPLLDQRPTLTLSSTSAVYGTIVTLRGHVDASTEGTITIERSISGGSWSVLGVAAADAAGGTSIRTTARANARYRLHVARSSTRIERTSSMVALTVRRKVALRSTSGRTRRGR